MATSRLPALREEIALLPGPRLPDGQPSWTLHDPARNQFFQIDWPSFEMLSRWHLGSAEAILADLDASTTLQLTPGDIDAMQQFLQTHELLLPPAGAARHLTEQLGKRRGSRWQWLLHNYLFFRIPLVKPDRWLSRMAPHVGFLFSRGFLTLTLLAAVLGLVSVSSRWESFRSTLVDMVSWQGLAAYGVTLALVKALHELGHGFAAKRYGCRVPTMGLAFLVLWPVAYTDTNDVWKLTERRQRLGVAAAGIGTELAIAAWATFAWAWLPEGWPKSVAFLLSTTTWISSVFINASPFMRFDGYFLLADFLNLPNLHQRAFALARWDLRERLFALGEPVPEMFTPRRARFLVVFAWATWIYRLTVFLGIAALVYHFFIKAVGILLFLVEIGWFVLLPFWNEFKAWRTRWAQLRGSPRARMSAMLAGVFLLLFVLPWPTRVGGSGLLQPLDQWPIYAPGPAQVAALPFTNGAAVVAGSVVLELRSDQAIARKAMGDARRQRLAWQSAAAGFSHELRADWQVLGEQLLTAQAEQASLAADTARLAPVAPYDGTLRDVPADLRVGDWVSSHELLGRLVRNGPRNVVTYVTEEDIHRLSVGDRAVFVGDGRDGPVVRLRVARIDRDAASPLPEPSLAHLFGGHVAVREKNGLFFPEQAVYRVELAVVAEGVSDEVADQRAWRGQVAIAGTWEAPGVRFLRAALSTFWREFGF